MRVKICGITNTVDALAAVDAGADAIGFVFVRSSRRYIDPGAAGEIVRKVLPFVTCVGVVADRPRDEVREILEISRVSAIQFHGNERPEELAGYPVPVYKAFRVSEGFRPESLGNYPGPAYLLDTGVSGELGGTGKSFDWTIAAAAREFGKIILAGGITPENVAEAIRTATPYAIDVSSGVESVPGVKDHDKLRRLFAALRGS